jgi:hypothetical protein
MGVVHQLAEAMRDVANLSANEFPVQKAQQLLMTGAYLLVKFQEEEDQRGDDAFNNRNRSRP